jgi:hypothetical protein
LGWFGCGEHRGDVYGIMMFGSWRILLKCFFCLFVQI